MSRIPAGNTLQRKLLLTVLAPTGAALLLGSLGSALIEVRTRRDITVERVDAIVKVIAANSAAAVAFADSASASELLDSLQEDTGVDYLALLDFRNRVLTTYRSANHAQDTQGIGGGDAWLGRALDAAEAVGLTDGIGSYRRVQPVVLDGKIIGHVYAQANLRMLRAALLWELGSFLLCCLLALAVAWHIAKRLQRPLLRRLEALSGVLRSAAECGDYSLRTAVDSDDELNALAHSINSLLGDVEQRDLKLRHSQQSIEKLFAEQARSLESAAQGLRSALSQNVATLEAAEVASRRRSEFLAHMGHEIRAPVNALSAMTELLRETAFDERQWHFADAIQQSVDALLEITNGMQDFSSAEAGKLPLEIEDFELRSMLEQTVELFAKRAQHKGLELLIDYESRIGLALRGDALRLRQVLMNLISNAIKFTSRGLVVVRVRCTAQQPQTCRILFEVQDTGIGIRADTLPAIFEAFGRDGRARPRRLGGAGLGLPITRQLAECMDGSISARSEFGRGSCFSVEIPFALAETAAELPRAEGHVHLGRRVLVADHGAISREIFKAQLAAIGFEVEVVSDGKGVLQWLGQSQVTRNHFDVVVLNSSMGDCAGIDVLRRMRAAREFAEMPAVLLGTPVDGWRPSDRELLQPLVVLNKPVRQSELRSALARLLVNELTGARAVDFLEQSVAENPRAAEEAGAAAKAGAPEELGELHTASEISAIA